MGKPGSFVSAISMISKSRGKEVPFSWEILGSAREQGYFLYLTAQSVLFLSVSESTFHRPTSDSNILASKAGQQLSGNAPPFPASLLNSNMLLTGPCNFISVTIITGLQLRKCRLSRRVASV